MGITCPLFIYLFTQQELGGRPLGFLGLEGWVMPHSLWPATLPAHFLLLPSPWALASRPSEHISSLPCCGPCTCCSFTLPAGLCKTARCHLHREHLPQSLYFVFGYLPSCLTSPHLPLRAGYSSAWHVEGAQIISASSLVWPLITLGLKSSFYRWGNEGSERSVGCLGL